MSQIDFILKNNFEKDHLAAILLFIGLAPHAAPELFLAFVGVERRISATASPTKRIGQRLKYLNLNSPQSLNRVNKDMTTPLYLAVGKVIA